MNLKIIFFIHYKMNKVKKFVEEYSYTNNRGTFNFTDETKSMLLKHFEAYNLKAKEQKKSLMKFLTTKKKLLEYLDELSNSVEVKRKRLGYINSFLKFNKSKVDYTNELDLYKKEYENQVDNYKVDVDTSKVKQITQPKDRLILTLYTKYPPKRSDYYSIKVRNVNKEEDNYFDFDNNTFVFNNLIKINQEGQTVVDDSTADLVKKVMSKHDSDYLFVYLQKGVYHPYNNKSFSNYISKISESHFEKKLTINDFRKIYSSTTVKDKPIKEALKIIEENAKNMGNSVSTQLRSYITDNVETKGKFHWMLE